MTRSAAKKVRVAIVHLAPDQTPARIRILTGAALLAHVSLVSVARLTRRDTRLQRQLGIEKCLREFQRLEDFVFRHVRESLMTHPFEQYAERDESEIAIDHARARFVLQIEIRNRSRSAFGLVFSK